MKLNNKKGFAFSFIALFLSMLIFSFVGLDLFQENYNEQSNFDSTRVLKISQENKYFLDIYFIDALKFSLYNSLSAVLNMSSSNSAFYNQFQKNSSKLNNIFQEILINGSLNSQSQPLMYNKTIYNLTKNYIDSYEEIQRGNIEYKILYVRIYEETPFYVDFQILAHFNITNQDNIASWEFNRSFKVSVPIFELKDPKYDLFTPIGTNNVPVIRSSTHFQGNQNWTLDLLNRTILNTYSTVYVEPSTKYTVGSSYLSSLLNVTTSSYVDVDGFWSFDYDLDENLIYDTSLNNQEGNLYGNNLIGLSFNNDTILTSPNQIEDISNYENNITYNNIIGENIFINCVSAECISLNETSSIEINESLFNIPGNQLSISMWFNTSSYIDSQGDDSYLFKYGDSSNEEILIYFNNGKLVFELGEHGSLTRKTFRTISNVTLNTWNHLVVTYNGNTRLGKIYLNGDIRNSRDNQNSSNPISSFSSSSSPINIGSNSGSSSYFNGGIDEFIIYSKEVTFDEVSNIYTQRKIQELDYVETLHGEGIFFNGFNNYLEIENSQNQFQYGTNEFSVCTWFKPDLINRGDNSQIIVDKSNSTHGFSLGINLTSNATFAQITDNNILKSNEKLFADRWYFSCLTRDSSNTFRLYLNDEIENSSSVNVNVSSDSNLFFGKNYINNNQNFSGIIDEVKLFSRHLDSEEIQRNYFSFNTFGKGCCNTLSLVNTNKFGFNDSSFNKNVSFSSKLFIDSYYNGKDNNNSILYSVDNITSTQTSQNYYNAFFDSCLIQVFNVADYTSTIGESIVHSPSPNTGINCYDLILNGVY